MWIDLTYRAGFLAVLLLASLPPLAAQSQEDVPLTSSVTSTQQFQDYLNRTYGWQTLSWLATDAISDHFSARPEWGRGPGGFGCDYGSRFGRRLVSTSAELGVSLVLREDVRFHPSQRTGLLPRLRYAVAHAFLDVGPRGRFEPAYARFAGIAAGAIVAPAWHERSLSAPVFFSDVAFGTLDQLQNSLLSEFGPDLRKLGRKVRRTVSR